MRPITSHSSSRSSVSPILPIIGVIALLIIGGIILLGSTTPDPTVASYEKTINATR